MTRRSRRAPIPPENLRFMGGTEAEFLEQADALADTLYRLGVRKDDAVLDVGCGYGRLAIGLSRRGFRGKYLGFDILARHVTWAAAHITPWRQRYRFAHLDVRNGRYNKAGTIEPEDARFPAPDHTADVAVLFSVFTHFYARDIEVYLAELKRVIKPTGFVVATYLLFDDATVDAARTTSAYPMRHQLDQDCIYNDAEDPLRAIAYRETFVVKQVRAAGFSVERVERGRWNGGDGPDFQDVVVFRPQSSAPKRAALTAQRAGVVAARGLRGRLRRFRRSFSSDRPQQAAGTQ